MVALKPLLKILNLAALLVATAWLARQPGWDSLVTFVGLLAALVTQEAHDAWSQRSVSKDADRIEYDRALFRRYDAILPEQALRWEIDNDLFNHHTDMGFARSLEEFGDLSERAEGMFLSVELQKSFGIFSERLRSLSGFITQHFFVPQFSGGTKPMLLYLYPELKNSPEEEKRERYRRRAKELEALVDQVHAAHKPFRKTVKSELSI